MESCCDFPAESLRQNSLLKNRICPESWVQPLKHPFSILLPQLYPPNLLSTHTHTHKHTHTLTHSCTRTQAHVHIYTLTPTRPSRVQWQYGRSISLPSSIRELAAFCTNCLRNKASWPARGFLSYLLEQCCPGSSKTDDKTYF